MGSPAQVRARALTSQGRDGSEQRAMVQLQETSDYQQELGQGLQLKWHFKHQEKKTLNTVEGISAFQTHLHGREMGLAVAWIEETLIKENSLEGPVTLKERPGSEMPQMSRQTEEHGAPVGPAWFVPSLGGCLIPQCIPDGPRYQFWALNHARICLFIFYTSDGGSALCFPLNGLGAGQTHQNLCPVLMRSVPFHYN